MDTNILVLVLSVLVFVLGALFINYTVKKDEAAEKEAKEQAAKAEAAAKNK